MDNFIVFDVRTGEIYYQDTYKKCQCFVEKSPVKEFCRLKVWSTLEQGKQ